MTLTYERFRELHRPGAPFLLPNAWDHASAAALVGAGFRAVGTTSLGVAAAAGVPDGVGGTREETLRLARSLSRLDALVSVDVEGGFSDVPEEVAALTVELADAGAVGVNLEDGRADGTLRDAGLHAEILRAVKEATGDRLFVNARTDTYWLAGAPVTETEARLAAYRAAGADGLFVPGLRDTSVIAALTASLDAPLNILHAPDGPSLDALAAAGVARVSCGSLLFRAALGAAVAAAVAVAGGRAQQGEQAAGARLERGGGAGGARQDIAALDRRHDRRGDLARVEVRRELAPLAPLAHDAGEPVAQPVERLRHGGAQGVAGDDVRVHRQPPDRAAPQHIALAQQIRLDARVRRSLAAEDALDRAPQLLGGAPDRGERQVGFAGEMVVHASLPRARVLLDRLGAGAHITPLPQEFAGGLDQTLRSAHEATVHTSRYSRQVLGGTGRRSRHGRHRSSGHRLAYSRRGTRDAAGRTTTRHACGSQSPGVVRDIGPDTFRDVLRGADFPCRPWRTGAAGPARGSRSSR